MKISRRLTGSYVTFAGCVRFWDSPYWVYDVRGEKKISFNVRRRSVLGRMNWCLCGDGSGGGGGGGGGGTPIPNNRKKQNARARSRRFCRKKRRYLKISNFVLNTTIVRVPRSTIHCYCIVIILPRPIGFKSPRFRTRYFLFKRINDGKSVKANYLFTTSLVDGSIWNWSWSWWNMTNWLILF